MENPQSLEIYMLEKKGTKTTLYWIKVILWIEFFLSFITTPLSVIYLSNRNAPDSLITFTIGFTIVYLFYYQFLIRQLKNFSYDGEVTKNLKKVYGYLRFFLLHYKVVIWVSLMAGVIYGLFYDPQNKEVMEKVKTTEDWLILGGIYAVIIGIVGGIFHLFIHLIYGKKIKRLKGMVRELESKS